MHQDKAPSFNKRAGSSVFHSIIVALAGVSAGSLLRAWLLSFGELPTFITFYPVVILTAMFLGAGAGIFAAILSALAANFFFMPHIYSLRLESPNQLIALGLFLSASVLISLMAEQLSRARRREAVLTERERAGADIARSAAEAEQQRKLLEVTLTSIGDAVIVADVSGLITFMNPKAESLTGWTSEAVGLPLSQVFNIISEQTREKVESPIEKALRLGVAVGPANHTILITKDGREIPIDDSGAPIRNPDGSIRGIVLVFRDFSEQKQAEARLLESQRSVRQKLDSILTPEGDIGELELSDLIDVPAIQSVMNDFYELARIPMSIIDLKGRVLVGVGWQEICTRYHRTHPEACKNCRESDLELTTGVPEGEFRLYKCKNNMWDIATPLMVGGQQVGFVFSGQFFFDDDNLDYDVFRAQAARYGFNEQEYVAALDKVPRLSRAEVNTGMAFLVKLSRLVSQLSFSTLKLARSLAQSEILMKSLRLSEERQRVTLTSIGDGIIVTDAEGRITLLNGEAEKLTGWSNDEAVRQPLPAVFRIINEQTRETVENPVDKVLELGAVVGLANHTILLAKDGREIPIDDSGAPIRDNDGTILGVVLVFRDFSEQSAAQRALQDSESHLKNTQKIAHLGSWELDLVNDRLSWSDETYRIFGLQPQEFKATYEAFLQTVHPEDRHLVDSAYSSSIREGLDAYEIEHRVVKRGSGEIRIVREKCEHIRDESGRVIKSSGMVHDITELKLAEADLRRVSDQRRLALDAARMGWWHNDPVTGLSKWDERFKEILGFSADCGPIEDMLKAIHPDDLPHVQAELEKALDRTNPLPYSVQFRVYRPDGAMRWVETHGIASFEGEGDACHPVSFVGTVADITERKQAEEDLQAAKARAEEANQAKDRFLATLSHELRTPLVPVLAGTELLLRAKDLSSDARQNTLTLIKRNVEMEARLIDDLLDLTRVIHGKVPLNKCSVDLHRVIRDAIDVCQAIITQKNQELVLDFEAKPSTVWGDATRIQQIIWNVLINAARFTPERGRISIATGNQDGNMLTVRIEDSGKGIEPSLQAKLFTAFEQGESSRGGLGLGLAISKSLVEMHNGKISVYSEGAGKGSTFTITLPVSFAEEAPKEDRPSSLAISSPVRVLLVEDHEDTGVLMKHVLELAGNVVHHARDVASALKAAQEEDFDVLLCDIGLPDGSGFDVIERLGKRRPGKAFALTGFGMDDDVQRSRAAGFDAHLTKPVDLDKLEEILRKPV